MGKTSVQVVVWLAIAIFAGYLAYGGLRVAFELDPDTERIDASANLMLAAQDLYGENIQSFVNAGDNLEKHEGLVVIRSAEGTPYAVVGGKVYEAGSEGSGIDAELAVQLDGLFSKAGAYTGEDEAPASGSPSASGSAPAAESAEPPQDASETAAGEALARAEIYCVTVTTNYVMFYTGYFSGGSAGIVLDRTGENPEQLDYFDLHDNWHVFNKWDS